MNYLILDCAYQPTAILVDGNKQDILALDTNNSDTYMQLIDQLLKQNGLTIDDIQNIAINVGPGSFTGLRVAISIAKGLGFGSNINFYTFNSFDYAKSDKVIVCQGFSNFVYVKQGDNMSCETIDSLHNAYKYITTSNIVFEQLKECNLDVELVEKKDYFSIISDNLTSKSHINQLEPLYLRKSQAEIQREAKVGKNG